MMTEKELIGKIRELRQIKPNKNWVVLTKTEILGEEKQKLYGERISFVSIVSFFNRFQQKPALAFVALFVTILFIGGLIFYFPGEQGRNNQFASLTEEEIKNLQPALQELNEKISQTTQELKEIKEPERLLSISQEIIPAMESGKAIVSASKKIKEDLKTTNKEKEVVAEVLAVRISETEKALGEMETTVIQSIQNIINDLEKRTLTLEQSKLFQEAKKDFENGNFTDALTKILMLNLNNY